MAINATALRKGDFLYKEFDGSEAVNQEEAGHTKTRAQETRISGDNSTKPYRHSGGAPSVPKGDG